MNPFDALHASVARMGTPRPPVTIDVKQPPRQEPDFVRELESGIVISLKDLGDSGDLGGLLGYRGAQVLLYIREQGHRLDQIREKPFLGPKYHVANCQTLREMKEQNRFGRYVVTNEVSGAFRLVDSERHGTREIHAELNVCKNCLKFLNYRGYSSNRKSVFENFSLPALFSTYSTLFEFLPKGVNMLKSSDPRAWTRPADIARDTVEDCRSCGVQLPGDSLLLGVPSGESVSRAGLICADCRRKTPASEPIHLSERDMKRIASARGNLPAPEGTWEEVFMLADYAFHGLLKTYQRQGHEPPEPGVELKDANGAVCLELGLAWPISRHAVVLHEREAELARAQGWEALALEAALLDSHEDG